MSYESILEELVAMKSHYQSGFSAIERTRIVELYKYILDKTIQNLACGDCYRDAYLEVFNYLKKNGRLPMRHYKLKSGYYLHNFGESKYYFNPVEDEVAESFLAKDPSLIDIFVEYPEDWQKCLTPEVKEEKVKRGRRKRTI